MALYALGSNKMGQLGVGHCDDVSEPTKCSNPHQQPKVRKDKVASISGGANHTAVLFESGLVWYAGTTPVDDCGQDDGNEIQGSNLSKAHFAEANLRISHGAGRRAVGRFKFSSTTWEAYTFIVTLDGRDQIVVWGSGSKGELGLGDDVTSTERSPRLVNQEWSMNDDTITDLASGLHHTVIVLGNGELWGWGYGRKGQLGTSVGFVAWIPTKIDGVGFPAKRVACGREFTVVAGSDGQLAILGGERWGIKGGVPEHEPFGFLDIQASWNGVYILQENGQLIAWGRNDKGQLPPRNLPPIVQFAAGSEHVLALTEDGEVLAWGWGEHGNCGTELDMQKNLKIGTWNVIWDKQDKMAHGKAVGIGAGCATSFIEVEENSSRQEG